MRLLSVWPQSLALQRHYCVLSACPRNVCPPPCLAHRLYVVRYQPQKTKPNARKHTHVPNAASVLPVSLGYMSFVRANVP
eukprot:2756083-Lingulodinium_polyedra.AAC.1